MTDNRWRGLLGRWLAGEPLRALADEYGVSSSAVHWNAKRFGLRKGDHRRAVRAPKGPQPVRFVGGEGEAGPRMICAELSIEVDWQDPLGTLGVVRDRMTAAARVGDWRTISLLGRMTHQLMALDERVRKATGVLGADGPGAGDGAGVEASGPRPAYVLRTAQRPPAGAWRTWLFLGGRGAGKTLAGAEWLADQAERLGRGGRLALIGPTLHDVREVMIEGVSGLRALPRWTAATRPVYRPSRRRLYFAGGAVAHVFSAEDPDALRGPQFSAAWADEFCAWPAVGARGAEETLAMLRMGLRLAGPEGDAPRLVVTTTPRPTRALIGLKAEASCVVTHAGTAENAGNLAPGFLDELRALYGGTRREAQELEGRIVDLSGALFTAEMLAAAREDVAAGGGPLDRVIVALDPTATAGGDACGIVVAGVRTRADGQREAVVLADRSASGLSPHQWASRAVEAARQFEARAVVAEVNQGGDMVRAVLKAAGCDLPVREVRATKGKRVRAEPVAALYEQGRVRHAGVFGALEEELLALGSEGEGAGSLDRADALVWAITDLLIARPDGAPEPRVRWL